MTGKRWQAFLFKPVMSHLTRLVVLSILIGSTCVFRFDSFAQHLSPDLDASSIRMQASPAFNGNFKYGERLPIWVELENSGPDLQAEIRVSVTSSSGTVSFITPVELPNLSRKRLPVYVLPNNFSRQLEVQLVSNNQELLASQKVSVQPHPNVTYFVGLVSSERGILSLIDAVTIPGTPRKKILIDISMDELPEKYVALRSFDLMVFNNLDTSSLNPDQADTLETWVEQGGRLVVGGGAGAASTVLGFPSALLPFKVEDSIEVESLSALEELTHDVAPIRVPGPFVVSTGKSEAGQVLVSQEDIPLIIEWLDGNGYIDFVALDLNASPFDAWSGTVDFWEKLISPGAQYPDWLSVDVSARQQFNSQMPYILSNLPMLDLPSAQGLAILLGLYIVLVGPVNYFFLRRKKLLHWAWITIPVITVIFSVAAFGMGYALHGTDIFINKISVLQLKPDGKAYVDGYIGLFSPANKDYEVEVLGGGLISPLDPNYDPGSSFGDSPVVSGRRSTILEQGDPAYFRGLSVEQFSMQSFLSEGIAMEFGPVAASLQMKESALVGEVLNGSSYFIREAAIIFGSKFVSLGDLPPGGTASVNMELVDLSAPNIGPSISYSLFEEEFNSLGLGNPSRQVEVKRSILETIFERIPSHVSSVVQPVGNENVSRTPVLIGWLDQAPPEVRISGVSPAQQTTAILLMAVPYRLPESGRVTLPPGIINGRIKSMPDEGGTCGMPGSISIYIIRGEAVFEFTIPPEARQVAVQNLKLAINTESETSSTPSVSIFNWTTEEWINLTGMSQGVNLVSNIEGMIDPHGLVQVRISADDAQACYYLGLGLEGDLR